jgi:carboxymethylenebutenolidase
MPSNLMRILTKTTLPACAAVLALGCSNHALRWPFVSYYRYTESIGPITLSGVRTRAEIYRPDQPGKHPGVVILYGSGGMKVSGPAYEWYAEALADRGIEAVICPYFDSTHGRQYRDHNNTVVWIPAVRDCVTFLVHQPDADASRIGVLGFSLGGYVGMSVIPHDPRIKAFVDFFGPEPKLSCNDLKKFPPTLIFHGAKDNRVGLSNSRSLAASLTLAGVENQLIIYPNQRHGFTGPDAEDAHRRTIDFLYSQLGAPVN